MRGATRSSSECHFTDRISIHAPHARSDSRPSSSSTASANFNPRSSCEERLQYRLFAFRYHLISIHAPHARSDSRTSRQRTPSSNFNPRSSCEERQGRVLSHHIGKRHFNPRSSCEERHGTRCRSTSESNFNPRSSCEERLEPDDYARLRANFNPRSSCEERPMSSTGHLPNSRFQSTLLMRGATARYNKPGARS